MPKPTRETDEEVRDPAFEEPRDDQQFSQDHDDKAGRSWHGLTSEVDEVGRFEEDADDEDDRAGRTERI